MEIHGGPWGFRVRAFAFDSAQSARRNIKRRETP